VSGAFTSSWNAVSPGITEDGYDLRHETREELVDSSDIYGDALIDFIQRGGRVICSMMFKEYKAGSLAPFWPWGGGALGVMATTLKPLGDLASNIAKAWVLTSVAGTPAAAAPATHTATLAILAPGFQGSWKYAPRLRKIPVELVYLPSVASGTVKWFTDS
jgi:hypothetical protein